MLDVQLVSDGTKTENGTGDAVDVSGAESRVFLFELQLTRMLEQQALELQLEWSSDGSSWGKMAVMPQQFYPGSAEIALDLRNLPQVRWVRARWELERWGRGGDQCVADFSVRMRETPQ